MSRDRELVDAALAVRERAWAPYSGYRVGAAVLDESGRLHAACNVENSAFPLGSCAETGAISAMVAAGGRRIVAIAAVGGRDGPEACTPCGGCRQRIAEFADDDTRVLLIDDDGEITKHSVAGLLPLGFRLGR